MAKSKGKEEVTEEITWTIRCVITAGSDKEVESTIEIIEENLENATDNVMTETTHIEDFRVQLD
jgi:hypothetical protein